LNNLQNIKSFAAVVQDSCTSSSAWSQAYKNDPRS